MYLKGMLFTISFFNAQWVSYVSHPNATRHAMVAVINISLLSGSFARGKGMSIVAVKVSLVGFS